MRSSTTLGSRIAAISRAAENGRGAWCRAAAASRNAASADPDLDTNSLSGTLPSELDNLSKIQSGDCWLTTAQCLAAGFSPTGPATGYTTEAQLSLVAAGLVGDAPDKRPKKAKLRNPGQAKLRVLVDGHPRGTPVDVGALRDQMAAQSDAELDQQLFFKALQTLAADDVVTINERAGTVIRR